MVQVSSLRLIAETMQLPQTKPRDDPNALWALQMELLSIAESALGPRDASKRICAPQFVDDGPRIRNTPSLDGAFVELSRAAEAYWPTVVYEMAHETVHLLDPIPGNTNNLEEGVAVEFSLKAQQLYGTGIQKPSLESYLYALRLVSVLPEGPIEAGKRLRNRVGPPQPGHSGAPRRTVSQRP